MTCLFSFQNKQRAPCQIPELRRDLLCVWSGAGGQLAGRAATINTSNEETQTQEETLGIPPENPLFFFPLWCVCIITPCYIWVDLIRFLSIFLFSFILGSLTFIAWPLRNVISIYVSVGLITLALIRTHFQNNKKAKS